jgi:HlyD family secretion protein
VARILISSLIVGALILGGWFLRPYFWPDRKPSVDLPGPGSSEPSDCSHSINALGYLQPRNGILSVSAQPGDQLAVLHVKEGTPVKAGKTLAELQSKELRFLEWKARESQRKEAEKQFAAEKLAAEKKVEAAKLAIEKIKLQDIEESAQQAQINFLKMNLELVAKNLERLKEASADLVSTQQIEQQQLLVEKTGAELTAAQSTLERMQASRSFAEKSAAAELEVAQAALEQVKAANQIESLIYAEKIAKLQYDHTEIEAPADGVVLQTFMQPGESVGTQPILQMANLDRMICQAEVFQTDIQCIHKGQTARVTSPAFPEGSDGRSIEGTVVSISQLVASPKLQSLDPYAAVDRHVVEVEIEFDAKASQIAGKFVNLQVQVEFVGQPDE